MKFFLAAFLLLSVCHAQDEGGKPQLKKANVAGVDEKAPVTKAEAAAVFSKARKVVNVSRVAKISPKSTITQSTQTVTRDEVVLEMAKIFEASKTAVKFVPSLVRYDGAVLKTSSAPAKAALAKLISWGFVAPVGPLAVGPSATMSPKEFGDAVGFFLSRLSDVTHMPSTKWSPYLQPGG